MRRFEASFADVEGEARGKAPFRFSFPADRADDVRVVQLVHGGDVLDRILVSENAPVLEIEAPAAPSPAGGRRRFRWSARDTDGDEIFFHIVYSPDDGTRWYPVARWARGRSLNVDTDRLPGGQRGKLRILATDGFHTTEAETSSLFEVPNKPPRPLIRTLDRRARFVAGEPVRLAGIARDVEDSELVGESLIWRVGDRVVGTGRKLRAWLPEGTWTVELEAVDAAGESGSATLMVTVEHPAPRFRRGDAKPPGRSRSPMRSRRSAFSSAAPSHRRASARSTSTTTARSRWPIPCER